MQRIWVYLCEASLLTWRVGVGVQDATQVLLSLPKVRDFLQAYCRVSRHRVGP